MKRWNIGLAGIMAAGLAMAEMPPGLVLRFSCDALQQGGTILPDVTGSNHNGRAAGVRFTPAGRLNGGCEFTGKNSSVQVPAVPLADAKQMTLCFWFKVGKLVWPDRTLAERPGDGGFALRIAAGDKQGGSKKGKLYAAAAGRDAFSDMPVADNAWHHAALIRDGESTRLYVDGIRQQQSLPCRGDSGGGAPELTLGMPASRSGAAAKNKDAAFSGLLDEILLFNRALTDAELQDAIAASKPKFTKQQVERRLRELKDLLDRGLILEDFYARKVKECEVSP